MERLQSAAAQIGRSDGLSTSRAADASGRYQNAALRRQGVLWARKTIRTRSGHRFQGCEAP